MVRKRFGITSAVRYQLKAYRVHKLDGVPPELAVSVASAQTSKWSFGFGPYHQIYETKVKPILASKTVPKELWGLYRAFMCELLSKSTLEDKRDYILTVLRWSNVLDTDVMLSIVEAIVGSKLPREQLLETLNRISQQALQLQ